MKRGRGFCQLSYPVYGLKSKLAIKICRLRAFLLLFFRHARPPGSMSHEKEVYARADTTVAKYIQARALMNAVLEEEGRKAGG